MVKQPTQLYPWCTNVISADLFFAATFAVLLESKACFLHAAIGLVRRKASSAEGLQKKAELGSCLDLMMRIVP